MVRTSGALEVCAPSHLKHILSQVSDNAYTHIVVPISHPRYKRILRNTSDNPLESIAFTRSELVVNLRDWSNAIIGRISGYIDVDSPDENYRTLSERLLNQELMFVSHLGVTTTIIRINKADNVNLSRIMYDRFCHENTPYHTNQFWFEIPMESPKKQAERFRSDIEISEDEDSVVDDDPWKWWCNMRTMVCLDRRLGLALVVSEDLPEETVLNRWLGEPIKAIIIPTSVFLTNRKGYPVLSLRHQSFIRRCAALGSFPIVSGTSRHVSVKTYIQYIDHIYQMRFGRDVDGTIPYTQGFEDHLQIPLQPLMDNLECHTYEIFEKDPVKYTEYNHAIYRALLDRVPPEEAETNVQVVMVVGAGRGPLVDAALKAADSAKRKVKVYAVEKNVNAMAVLYHRKMKEWPETVELICSDMREWKPPQKCDILVSELLGSFGDNELSPECLDGAQHLLKDDGISIPCEYSSYISPTMSCKLHAEVTCQNATNLKTPNAKYEMPYVVHQLNTYRIAPIQKAFTFVHPNKDEFIDNNRYKKFIFDVSQDCVIHGFSGYFDTLLYKDASLSIVPDTHSKGMFSWFPIFFPIKEPVMLKKGDKLVAHFWRLSDKTKVWYEWSISEPFQLPIHNPNGRSYYIGLF